MASPIRKWPMLNSWIPLSWDKIFAEKCNKFDFITFQKKSYFKGGNMKLTNVVGCNKSLSQIDSILSINRKLIKEQKYDSKKLYE